MFEEGLGGEIVTTISKPGIENAHTTQNQNQHLESLNDTESRPPLRPMYFAYGSNLSYSQMKRRCANHPEKSAKPVAIARLDKWRWFICENGYANVMPPKALRVSSSGLQGENVPVSGKEDAVFGILYDMTIDDEDLLDMYEGVDDEAADAPPDGKVDRKIRPKEQGDGSYNKWYVPVIVTKWLDGRDEEEKHGGKQQQQQTPTVLVYIDERHVRVGPPKTEYIARMDRAVRESVELGLPNDWAESVIRKFV
jgi:hypothetical protein